MAWNWRIVSLDGHHYPPEMLEQFRADPALRKDIDEFSDLPDGEDLYMAIRNWMQDFGAEYPLATKNPDGSFEVETEHSASEVQDECFMLEEGNSFSTMLSFRAPVKAPLLLDCDLSDAPVLYNKLRQYEFGAAKDFIDDNGLDMTVGEFLDEYIVEHEDEDDDIARDWKSHLDDWYDDWVDCRCDVSLIVQPKGLPGICELKTTVYLEYGDPAKSVITDWLFESDTVCSSKRDFMENGRRAIYAALGALPENFK